MDNQKQERTTTTHKLVEHLEQCRERWEISTPAKIHEYVELQTNVQTKQHFSNTVLFFFLFFLEQRTEERKPLFGVWEVF